MAGPEAAGLLQPGPEFIEPGGVERLDARLALGAGGDEARLAQHVQVLRNGGRAQVEFVHEIARGPLALGEELDDAAAGRVGDGGEALHAG